MGRLAEAFTVCMSMTQADGLGLYGPALHLPPRLRRRAQRQCRWEKGASASSTASSEEPSVAPPAGEPTAAEVITAQNNLEFAALLKADPCDEANMNFATKHEGRAVAFDGSIRHMASYGDGQTRCDFLLGPGDKGPQTSDGPNFEYEDVNTGNLHLTGKQVPATVAVGDKFHFVAEVIEFNTVQCVFRPAPVSTETR